MRPVPGRTLLLLGVFFGACSVFPETAPLVGASTGGSGAGGAGAGAAGTTPGGAAGTAPDSGAGGAEASGGALDASGGSPESGVDAGSGGLGVDGSDARSSDTGGSIEASPGTVRYVASVADCVEAVTPLPKPGSCLSFTTLNDGPNELWVDVRCCQHRAYTTYLAFPVDDIVANHTIDAVELRITVTSYANASGAGADVWQVGPFTAQTLYLQTPVQVGTALATSLGAAPKGQAIVYELPASAIKPNATLYLGLYAPLGSTDGTGYWGLNGDPAVQPPPTIVVSYH